MAKGDESTAVAVKESGVVATRPLRNRLDDETLRTIQTPEDALEALRQQFGDQAVVRASEAIGNGFAIATDQDKERMAGIPLLLMTWDFNPGKYYGPDGKLREFVSITLITGDGKKFIVNDGSTGLCQQLADFTNRFERQWGMEVKHGFKVSKYFIGADVSDPETYGRAVPDDWSGPKEPAMTLYLDTSS